MIKSNDKKIFKHKIVIKTIYVGNKRFIDVFADVVLEDIKKHAKLCNKTIKTTKSWINLIKFRKDTIM